MPAPRSTRDVNGLYNVESTQVSQHLTSSPAHFVTSFRLNALLQEEPLRMLHYRADWLHSAGWAWPGKRGLRGTVFADRYLWFNVRAPD